MPSNFYLNINNLWKLKNIRSCQGNSLRSNCCLTNTAIGLMTDNRRPRLPVPLRETMGAGTEHYP